MATERYGRYVLVEEKKGLVAWYDSRETAEKDKGTNGGEVFDTEAEDPENIEIILHHARKNMGVE